MKHTCEKRLYSSMIGPGYLHGVGAKYEYEGKWYCKTHHPPTVMAKSNEQARQWRAEWDAKDAARAKDDAIREAERRVLEAASDIVTSDPLDMCELYDAVRDLKALGWEP